MHFYIFVMLIELVSVRLPSINLNQKEDENDHLQGNLKQQKKDFDTLGSMQVYRLDAQGPLGATKGVFRFVLLLVSEHGLFYA